MAPRLPDDLAELRDLLPQVLGVVRSRRAALLADLARLGGQAPAAADFAEPSAAGPECEDSPAALQQLIRQALSCWYQQRNALEAAIQEASPVRSRKRARAEGIAEHSPAAPAEPIGLERCFHKSFTPAELRERIWEYIQHETSPYHVNLRNGPVKTRPKVNFSIARKEDEYEVFSCYRWGQHSEDWTPVEVPPACILELA